MTGTVRLGRVLGITISIDWSWVLIFLLITLSLGAGVFPEMHPNWGPALNWGMAIAASLLFFASVLAHELAHSLVARARGLPVSNITLFLFGGVSNLQREPDTPGAEFVMAIVGPLTSIVLGILFLVLGNASADLLGDPLQVAARLDPLSTLLLWLGPVNIALGIFNMVPGFPLDGGRVLRSILWAASRSLRDATRWASWISQFIAWLFMLAGIAMAFGVSLPFFGTGLVSGLWLAFIGWFLSSAAMQNYRQVVLADSLKGVPVSRLMLLNVSTVAPESSVEALIEHNIMGTSDYAFPVVEDDRLAGMVSLHDVQRVPQDARATTRVSQIMTPVERLAVATPQEDAMDALNELAQRNVRQLPVVQDSRLVGLLRRRDVLRWLQLNGAAAH